MTKDPRVYVAQIVERIDRVHQYEGVDLPRMWLIIQRDLPLLRHTMSALLPPLDQLEREIADGQEGVG